MKRTLLVLLALALVLVSFACSKSEKPVEPEKTEEADIETEAAIEEPTEAPTEAPTDAPEKPSEEPDKVEAPDDLTIVIGKPIIFDNFEIVITEFKVVDTVDGKYALSATYDWINTSDQEEAPIHTFVLRGFQNNVKTDFIVMVEDNSWLAMKEVEPGGTVTGIHETVPIEDINAPLRLELLERTYTFDEGVVYSLEFEDLHKYK